MEITICYYGKNDGTILKSIELPYTKRKKHSRLPKTMKLWFIMKNNYGNIPKQLKFLNKYIVLKL